MNPELIELSDALFATAQKVRTKTGKTHIDLPSPAEIVAELPGWTIAEADRALRLAGAAPVWCGDDEPNWRTAHQNVRWITPATNDADAASAAKDAFCIDLPKGKDNE